MARQSFLVRLVEEKRRERLQQLLEELDALLEEYERLRARTLLTLGRIRLVLSKLEEDEWG